VASLGIEPREPRVPDAFAAADRFHLVDERLRSRRWRRRVEADACTPEQADDPGYAYLQRGLGWVPHMRTHASSVVWDLTRAILLSPGLHDQAQPHLDAARRRLGDAEFRRLSAEVAEHLRRRGG
jgi:hypothetical protein